MSDFTGKTVVITGASRGIGFAIAEAFAKAHANLSLCATHEEALRQAAEKLSAYGVQIHTQAVDISRADQCEDFIQRNST